MAATYRKERLEKFAAVLRFRKTYHNQVSAETTDPVESKNNRLISREYDKLLHEFIESFGLDDEKK